VRENIFKLAIGQWHNPLNVLSQELAHFQIYSNKVTNSDSLLLNCFRYSESQFW
jgi:hypothetical protein